MIKVYTNVKYNNIHRNNQWQNVLINKMSLLSHRKISTYVKSGWRHRVMYGCSMSSLASGRRHRISHGMNANLYWYVLCKTTSTFLLRYSHTPLLPWNIRIKLFIASKHQCLDSLSEPYNIKKYTSILSRP